MRFTRGTDVLDGDRRDARWWEQGDDGVVVIPAAVAKTAAVALLLTHSVPRADAEITVEHLIDGDLRGYSAHGIERLLQIIAMLRHGTLRPTPQRRSELSTPGTAVVDGDGGLGPPAAGQAIALARSLATANGIAMVGVRNAGHLGTLAGWAERAAGDDAFALVVSASEPGVVVPGGTRPLFGTNPIAFSWPAEGGHVTADFSTAAISRSHLLKSAELGVELPPGVANDEWGKPTVDPAQAMHGGLLPMGLGHKGVLLSLLASVLAGPLVGGPAAHEVKGTRHSQQPPAKADMFLVVRIDAMSDANDFQARLAGFVDFAKQDPAFRMPGERARAHRRHAAEHGITINARVARLLLEQTPDPGPGLRP